MLGEYVGLSGPEAEVADPFGSDLDVYRETYEQLESFIAKAADRLIADHQQSRDADQRP